MSESKSRSCVMEWLGMEDRRPSKMSKNHENKDDLLKLCKSYTCKTWYIKQYYGLFTIGMYKCPQLIKQWDLFISHNLWVTRKNSRKRGHLY